MGVHVCREFLRWVVVPGPDQSASPTLPSRNPTRTRNPGGATWPPTSGCSLTVFLAGIRTCLAWHAPHARTPTSFTPRHRTTGSPLVT